MDIIVNYWAVLAAGIANFIIGGLWYSPLLFAKAWMAASGKTEEDLKKGGQVQAMAWGFVGAMLTAFVLAHFIKMLDITTVGGALPLAFWTWLGYIVTTKLADVAFESQSKTSFLIYVSYQLVAFLVMASILALWG
ncbi:MAG: DUF1761 domain-containing protein [Patescibacteria group bacterium]